MLPLATALGASVPLAERFVSEKNIDKIDTSVYNVKIDTSVEKRAGR